MIHHVVIVWVLVGGIWRAIASWLNEVFVEWLGVLFHDEVVASRVVKKCFEEMEQERMGTKEKRKGKQ